MAKVDMVHVPYKGGAAAMTDLLGGRINVIFSSASTALPQITAGKINAIAVTTLQRSPLLPNVPTIAESGLPGFEAANWYGIVVPIKTPQPIAGASQRGDHSSPQCVRHEGDASNAWP
jgi:tripartite-type tricarboxylate transporter receptor subunit TctC